MPIPGLNIGFNQGPPTLIASPLRYGLMMPVTALADSLPVTSSVKFNPGHYLQSVNRNGNSFGTGGNGRNQSEVTILSTTGPGGAWAGSKFIGYQSYYTWSLLEPTQGTYNLGAIFQDFDMLQSYCPGARMVICIGNVNPNGGYTQTSKAPIPNYILNDASYGSYPGGGSSNNGMCLYGYNGSTWQDAAAALWRPAVMARWMALFQAMATTSFVTAYGPYAGQTFTLDTHPLIEGIMDYTENSSNIGYGPAAPADWSAAAQNAGWQTEMATVPTYFQHTAFATFQSYGDYGSTPDPNLPGLISYAASNRNALSNSDVYGLGIAQTDAYEIYCGNQWNGSAWVSGGTDYRGTMALMATVQGSDYYKYPGGGSTPAVSQIYNTCVTLKATHILWAIWDLVTGSPSTFVPTYLTPFVNANPVPNITKPGNYP